MQVSVYYQSVVFLILAAVALFASRFESRPDWQALLTICRHPPASVNGCFGFDGTRGCRSSRGRGYRRSG